MSSFIPTVIQKSANYERAYDIYSFLLQNRIVFLTGEINDLVANSICAQLIFLESQDSEKPIHLYINSPGGAVYSAFSILDTMEFIKPEIHTWAMGLAASCASFLLAAGAKGHRNSLPRSRVMIHEPWGGYKGRSRHIEDHAKEMVKVREMISEVYFKNANSSLTTEKLKELMDGESFLSPEEAKELGLIDRKSVV